MTTLVFLYSYPESNMAASPAGTLQASFSARGGYIQHGMCGQEGAGMGKHWCIFLFPLYCFPIPWDDAANSLRGLALWKEQNNSSPGNLPKSTVKADVCCLAW